MPRTNNKDIKIKIPLNFHNACGELNVDHDSRCILEKGHDGPHRLDLVSESEYNRLSRKMAEEIDREIIQEISNKAEGLALSNSLRRAEIHALDLAKELRNASLAVSKLFP